MQKLKLFPIEAQGSGWCVTWPKFRDIRQAASKRKLADFVFNIVGAEQAAFGIVVGGGNPEYVWMASQDQDANVQQFLDFENNELAITGVVFEQKYQAVELQMHLEKQLVWRKLST